MVHLDWRAVFLGATLPLLLVMVSLDSVWSDLTNYEPIFTSEGYGFDHDIAIKTTMAFIDYVKAPQGSKLIGTPFNATELSHMADVKAVFKAGFALSVFLLLIWVICLRLWGWSTVKSALRFGGLAGLVLVLLIAIVPFNTLFTIFHKVLFPSGTWTFPRGSVIITIYPLELFSGMAYLIALRSVILMVIAVFVGFLDFDKIFGANRLSNMFK